MSGKSQSRRMASSDNSSSTTVHTMARHSPQQPGRQGVCVCINSVQPREGAMQPKRQEVRHPWYMRSRKPVNWGRDDQPSLPSPPSTTKRTKTTQGVVYPVLVHIILLISAYLVGERFNVGYTGVVGRIGPKQIAQQPLHLWLRSYKHKDDGKRKR